MHDLIYEITNLYIVGKSIRLNTARSTYEVNDL